MSYNWQQKDWPEFRYHLNEIEEDLFVFAEKAGRISGMIHSLSKENQIETILELMVAEALKTSAIEGEYLNRSDVMSSIRNNLGLNKIPERVSDQRATGISELMISVQENYAEILTEDILFSWHGMIMRGRKDINVGSWRTHAEPMQITSGAIGKEIVHFEAPPSRRVPDKMAKFIAWYNNTGPHGIIEIGKAPVRSAIAHLYFESIHPFEDGNGRIGRALSEKTLSQGIGRPILISLSRTIEAKKNIYYNALTEAQQSNEITSWIHYFVRTILSAQTDTEELIEFSLMKTKFFETYKDQLNERQLKVIRRMLDEGPKGFESGINATKYMHITTASKATATRDLKELSEKGVLSVLGKSRSTRYEINFQKDKMIK